MNPVVTSGMARWTLIAGGEWWNLHCPASFELWSKRRFRHFVFHNKEHRAWAGPRCCHYCGTGTLRINSVIIRNEIYICRRISLKLRIAKVQHVFMDKKCRFHPKLGVVPGLLQNAEWLAWHIFYMKIFFWASKWFK